MFGNKPEKRNKEPQKDWDLYEKVEKIQSRIKKIELILIANDIITPENELDKYMAKAQLMSRKFMGIKDFKDRDADPTSEEWKFAKEMYLQDRKK